VQVIHPSAVSANQVAQAPGQAIPPRVPATGAITPPPGQPGEAAPGPRPLDLLGQDYTSLPLLGNPPAGPSVTPEPRPETLREFGKFVEGTVDPQNTLAAAQSQVINPSAVGANQVAQAPGQAIPPKVPATGAIPAPGQPGTLPPPGQPGEATPAPRPLDVLSQDYTRLPLLGNAPAGISVTPKPTPETLREFSKFIEGTVDPQNTLDLVVGRSRLLILKEAPRKYQIETDEKHPVVTSLFITPTELSLLGQRPGAAVMNFWFDDPEHAGKLKILSYLVRVVPDPEAKQRLENVYKALADEINHTFPDSFVMITLAGDKLVVTGQAKDAVEATQIIRVISANAPRTAGGEAAGTGVQVPVGPVTLTSSNTQLGLTGATTQTVQQAVESYVTPGSGNIVNLLRIPGEQQVMLKVTVAEINRTAARSIGVNFNITNKAGRLIFGNETGNIATSTSGGVGTGTGTGINSGTGSNNNLPISLDNGQISVALNALRTLDFARTLAEPNLVAINGQQASFHVGGQFPVPVVTGFTAAGLQGVSFVPFGVDLNFTPFITDRDRIRLVVNADVSTLSPASSASVNGTTVPGLNDRTFSTTVELRQGQTLAVAGLIQNTFGADSNRVPFFGDLPVVGRLFAFDRTSSGEQELVVLITPELVHPLDCHEKPPIPGADVFEPGDIEFYLLGHLEGRRIGDYRTSVRTDIARMIRYNHCEDVYIIGPQGPSSGGH
jgi:pilus assembly protein CpaC